MFSPWDQVRIHPFSAPKPLGQAKKDLHKGFHFSNTVKAGTSSLYYQWKWRQPLWTWNYVQRKIQRCRVACSETYSVQSPSISHQREKVSLQINLWMKTVSYIKVKVECIGSSVLLFFTFHLRMWLHVLHQVVRPIHPTRLTSVFHKQLSSKWHDISRQKALKNMTINVKIV